jgi:RNA polymerase sigma-70 factor (ECF subfamily)
LRERSAAGGAPTTPKRPSGPSGPLDEARLLRCVANGDVRAFEDLYRLYHPRLTRFTSTLLRRPDLVEEVVDDTLMAIWRKPDSYSGASKVSTWVFAIAYRKALKARHKADLPVESDETDQRPSGEAGPEQQLGQAQTRALLRQAMETLTPDHRAVVDLTYFQGIGYREIAQIMDCPVDTVKTRMFHARRRLKQALPGALTDWL